MRINNVIWVVLGLLLFLPGLSPAKNIQTEHARCIDMCGSNKGRFDVLSPFYKTVQDCHDKCAKNIKSIGLSNQTTFGQMTDKFYIPINKNTVLKKGGIIEVDCLQKSIRIR